MLGACYIFYRLICTKHFCIYIDSNYPIFLRCLFLSHCIHVTIRVTYESTKALVVERLTLQP